MRTRTHGRWLRRCALLAVLSAVGGCGAGGGDTSWPPVLRDHLRDPAYPQEYFETATPEDVGLSSALLDSFDNALHASSIHSLLVLRHGKLVFERYGIDRQNRDRQLTPDDTHVVWCDTKSVISALAGIAIGEGAFRLDDPVMPFFGDARIANRSAAKDRMTIEDLLTMRSGLAAQDDARLWNDPEAGVYALSLPMIIEPGREFFYQDGDPCIVNSILYRTTGKTPSQYAAEKLFGPLGITHWQWDTDRRGLGLSFRLHLRPRDMLKLGYLYLHQGAWEGTQVVPADWVATSTRDHVGGMYGYYWWTQPDGFWASGMGGQFIFVYPELDMVIVFTGWVADGDDTFEEIAAEIARSAA